VLSVAGKRYQICECLQWLCSALGLLILAWSYRRWLRRRPKLALQPSERQVELRRYAWLSLLGLLAALAALPFANANATGFHGWRACAFEEWVHAARFFCALLTLYALLRYSGRRGAPTIHTTRRA
jgi:hypothetical protein